MLCQWLTSRFVCSSLRSSVNDFGAYLSTQSRSWTVCASGMSRTLWPSELASKAFSITRTRICNQKHYQSCMITNFRRFPSNKQVKQPQSKNTEIFIQVSENQKLGKCIVNSLVQTLAKASCSNLSSITLTGSELSSATKYNSSKLAQYQTKIIIKI